MFYNNVIGQVLRRRYGESSSIPAPGPNSFFARVWTRNQDLYHQTIQTPFIQRMAYSILDPEDYSHLYVVDIYYCFKAVASLRIARDRVPSGETELRTLFDGLIEGYDEYNQYFADEWHVRGFDGIIPTPNFKNYSDFEEKTAKTLHPIYTLVTYIPCYYLWYNLGSYLQPFYKNTLYKDWIDGNTDPTPGYQIGNLIEDWIAAGKEWDETLAFQQYRTAMTHEFNAFNEAAK